MRDFLSGAYRYYVSRRLVTGTSKEGPGGWRLPALQIERFVAEETIKALADRKAVAAALEKSGTPTEQLPSVLVAADQWCQRLRSDVDRNEAMTHLVDRVELRRNSIRLTVSLGALVEGGDREIILAREISLTLKRRGVEMRLIIENGATKQASVDTSLLKEVIRARRCFEALLTGRAASVEQAAALEGIDPGYVSNLLPLAFLSPDIVEAIAKGTQPVDLTAKKLVRRIDLPIEWQAQKKALGFQ